MRAVKVEVFGRVQGVFFRASTRRKARELGLVGWVKNRPDGSVEIMAQGDEQAVQALIEWAYDGPDRARVDELKLTEDRKEGSADAAGFEDFQVRR